MVLTAVLPAWPVGDAAVPAQGYEEAPAPLAWNRFACDDASSVGVRASGRQVGQQVGPGACLIAAALFLAAFYPWWCPLWGMECSHCISGLGQE